MKLKNSLKGKLTSKELKLIPRSFDVIGEIAVFQDFPEELKLKEKIIAQKLMELNKNIKTVVKKIGKHSGIHRTRKVKIINGKRSKKTIHRENNVLIKLNIETSYFSPRLSNDRLNISKKVKKEETILVMFSGVAPYPLVLSKNSKAKEIYGVEINKDAHNFAKENLKLNKINNIKLYLGNVNKVISKLKKKFDRILMPLPETSYKYLKLAKKVSKKNAIIHLYTFDLESSRKEIRKLNLKLIKKNKVGQIFPRKYRYRLDIKN